MPITNNQQPKKKRSHLHSIRQRFVSNWERVAHFVEPDRKFNTQGWVNESTPAAEAYQDTTLARALRINASGQHELVMPKQADWFSFSPLANVQNRESLDFTTKEKYAQVGREVSTFMRNSNLHTAAELFFWDRATYGIGALWSEWDRKKGCLKFAHIPIGSFMVDKDKFGEIEAFCWDEWLDPSTIVNTYPEKVIPQDVRQKYEADSASDDNRLVFHLLERVDHVGDAGISRRAKGRPWVMRSVYDTTGEVLSEQFFWWCPVICCNCNDIPNSSYGYGFGKMALADQVELVNCLKSIAEAAQQKIFPPMLVPEGFTGNIGWGAGEVTSYNPLNVNARPQPLFTQVAQSQDAQWQVKRLEKNIQDVCDVNLFMPLIQVENPQYMKATVAQMIETYSARIASPVYTRLTEQFLEPLVRRCYSLLVEEGILPDLNTYYVQFNTPFQILLDQHQPQLFTEFMQNVVIPLAQIDETVLDGLDIDYIFRRSILDIGCDPHYAKPESEVENIREQRAQAEQQQQQQEIALQASQVQKNLAEAQGINYGR